MMIVTVTWSGQPIAWSTLGLIFSWSGLLMCLHPNIMKPYELKLCRNAENNNFKLYLGEHETALDLQFTKDGWLFMAKKSKDPDLLLDLEKVFCAKRLFKLCVFLHKMTLFNQK